MLTGKQPPRLSCGRCGAGWPTTSQASGCQSCQQPLAVDDVGIVRLAASEGSWPEVPPGFAEAVLRASTAEQVIEAMTDGPRALPARLQQRLLQPSGGAAAVLAPARPGLDALDLGSGWANLASALGSMGHTVTGADWSYARLRFGCLLQRPAPGLAVQLKPGRPLPFADRSFDVVFADSAEIRRGLRQAGARHTAASAGVLAEVHRVLKDGGCLVYGTSNPLRGRTAGSGQPDRRGRLWELTGLMRDPGKPWGERDLARVGFADFRVVVASPRRRDKHWLVPLERLGSHLGAPRAPASARQAAKQWLRSAAARAGAGRWLVSDYYVLARRGPAEDGAVPTLAESLDPFRDDAPPLVQMLSDARVAIVGSSAFVKFPLSVHQQAALLVEVDKTAAARSTVLRDFVIPWTRVGNRHGVPYTVFPRVEHRTQVRPAEALQVLHTVLDSHRTPRLASLQETALWRRMATERGQSDIHELDARALYQAVLATCAGRVVPVGPTHGDLHVDNVLLSRQGGALLVDWNRFEADNPLFLDPAYAAVRGHERRTRVTLATSLLAFLDDTLDDALAERARSQLGELDPLSAAVLLLLDRVVSYSEPRRRTKPWTAGPLLDAVHALSGRLR